MSMDHTSYWVTHTPGPTYSKLDRDLEVDVAIIGAGITGVTAALLLKHAGKKVAVIDAHRVAQGVTGYTTAHLTEAIDTRYTTLIRRFGLEGAKLAAQASRAAIERIAAFVHDEALLCGFERLPGYLFTEKESELGALHDEFEAAKRVGLDVEMTRDVPLPFGTAAGLRFANQAQFNIREYLLPLVARIPGDGSHVFEDTRVVDVHKGSPCRLETSGGIVRAAQVIIAANVPFNRVFLQTKIGHYRSYAIAARVKGPPLRGLFWDMDDPYHYLRSADAGGTPVLICGGEDHKTGQEENTAARYEAVVKYTRERFIVESIDSQWSAQVIEPVDGLPYIGHNALSSDVFVATGYSGNGMTFGTAAGMILSDAILRQANPWADLFKATRVTPLASAKEFVRENAGVPAHLIGDRLKAPDAQSTDDVKPGEGKLVDVGGHRLAVYRHDDGALQLLSSVCPHLGCTVHFNNAERTWDCPCHGSRFATDGDVLNGPATSALTKVGADGKPIKAS